MRVSDIDYIDGCTGEVLTDMTSKEMFDREVVKIEQTENAITIWTVLKEDLPVYYAFEYNTIEKMTFKEFLSHCTCCGGDWVSMLFTGLHECFPKVWDAIPNDKVYSFTEICELIENCGVIIE